MGVFFFFFLGGGGVFFFFFWGGSFCFEDDGFLFFCGHIFGTRKVNAYIFILRLIFFFFFGCMV